MSTIPEEKNLDNSLQLLREGFPFLHSRFQRFQSDIFKTRLMMQNVICLHGEEATKLFYDPEKFMRLGAIPKRIQKTLMGENGIQTLDGEEHRKRKAMFMSLMTRPQVTKVANLAADYWWAAIGKWEKMDQVKLFDEVQDLLCRVACQWSGVPLPEKEVRKRAQDFGDMVDGFGGVGPRHWKGKKARRRGEKWIMEFVEDVRAGKIYVAEDTPARTILFYRDTNGKLLDTYIAAVELMNILRPIVAIATYITFGALAMYTYPECRQKLQANEDNYAELFVQEVRRFYPFGPFLGNRVRQDFEWGGHHFKKGTLVFLDMYGALHDPKIWEHPDDFRPERFRTWDESPYNFIPQGGGDHYTGHRCAGERITIEVMKVAAIFMTHFMDYQVPPQDLSFSLVRMPTLPKSGFVMRNVRRIQIPVSTALSASPAATAYAYTGGGKCPFHHS
ncbi:cytochrome P450 [Rufibacter immobilis]|uniref:cytochrome P450 n=1 Tax=Rufibacter immobilis TaxID=1348778 RepID=UPI0035ED9FA9